MALAAGGSRMRLRSLQDLCEEIVTDVEGALGCAFVDLQTGLPLTLKVRTGGLFDANAMDVLSVAGVAYFADNGSGDASGDGNGDDMVQEIQTTTEDAYCFMSRIPGEVDELLILVTDRKTTNLGLGWMSMRQALRQVEAIGTDDAPAAAEPPPAEPVRQPTRSNDAVFPTRSRGRRSIWS